MVWSLTLAALVVAAPGELDGHWAVGAEATAAGRYNPVGAAASVRTTLRWHAFPRGHPLRRTALGDQLFGPSSVGLAAVVDANPALVRAGMGVEVTPAAVLRTRLTWQAAQTFGTFSYLQPFDGRGDTFDAFSRWKRRKAGVDGEPRVVQRLVADTLLQFKLWRVVALDLLTVDASTAGEDRWLYNGEYDLLLNGRLELVLRNIALVALSLLDRPGIPEVSLGMFHAFTHAVVSRGQNQQLGAALVLGPPLRGTAPRFVSVILLAGVHVQARSRELTPWMVALGTVTF